MRRAALFAVVCVASLSAAPVPKGVKVKDEEAIVGTWEWVSSDDGTRLPPIPVDVEGRLTFERGGTLVRRNPRGEEQRGGFTFDPAVTPKGIDFTDDRGTALGVYELDGDTLLVCKSRSGKVRPPSLKAEANRFVVMTFKRVKDEGEEERKDR